MRVAVDGRAQRGSRCAWFLHDSSTRRESTLEVSGSTDLTFLKNIASCYIISEHQLVRGYYSYSTYLRFVTQYSNFRGLIFGQDLAHYGHYRTIVRHTAVSKRVLDYNIICCMRMPSRPSEEDPGTLPRKRGEFFCLRILSCVIERAFNFLCINFSPRVNSKLSLSDSLSEAVFIFLST